MTLSQGCWQRGSVLCQVDLSVRLLEDPYGMAAGFPQSDLRERKGKGSVFYDLVSKVSHNYLHHFLFIRSKLLSIVLVQGEGNQAPPLEGRSAK